MTVEDTEAALVAQEEALLALAELGELMIGDVAFPYKTPSADRADRAVRARASAGSNELVCRNAARIPVLYGRAKLTVTIRRPPAVAADAALVTASLLNVSSSLTNNGTAPTPADADVVDAASSSDDGPGGGDVTSLSSPSSSGSGIIDVLTGGSDLGTIDIILDGFTAPVSAGNALDLILRGFYQVGGI